MTSALSPNMAFMRRSTFFTYLRLWSSFRNATTETESLVSSKLAGDVQKRCHVKRAEPISIIQAFLYVP